MDTTQATRYEERAILKSEGKGWPGFFIVIYGEKGFRTEGTLTSRGGF